MSDRCTMIVAARGDELGRAIARDVTDALAARFPDQIDFLSLAADELNAPVTTGRADVAVHRLEHLPPALPGGLTMAAILPRRAFTDALVSDFSFADLPREARIATSDFRRRAMLLRSRPDLKVIEAHSDVRTRVKMWRVGEWDGLVLPTYALRRLALETPIEEFDPASFVPSAGQGALACVCKPGSRFEEFLQGIDDAQTRAEVEVERAILRGIGGEPGLPVGIHAVRRRDSVTALALVLSLDGRSAVTLKRDLPAKEPLYEADEFAEQLKRMGADVLVAQARRVM